MAQKPSIYEYARILRIGAVATMRGELTTKQKRTLERLVKRAEEREARQAAKPRK